MEYCIGNKKKTRQRSRTKILSIQEPLKGERIKGKSRIQELYIHVKKTKNK